MVDLRKLRDVIPAHIREMPLSWEGIVGSLLAGFGAFCPLIAVAGHNVTYFARGHGDGQIVVGAAFIGLMGALIRTRFVTSLSGVVIAALLFSLYQNDIAPIVRMHHAAGNAGVFSGPLSFLAGSVTVGYGLYVMAFGAALMVLSPLIRRRRRA